MGVRTKPPPSTDSVRHSCVRAITRTRRSYSFRVHRKTYMRAHLYYHAHFRAFNNKWWSQKAFNVWGVAGGGGGLSLARWPHAARTRVRSRRSGFETGELSIYLRLAASRLCPFHIHKTAKYQRLSSLPQSNALIHAWKLPSLSRQTIETDPAFLLSG